MYDCEKDGHVLDNIQFLNKQAREIEIRISRLKNMLGVRAVS